MGNEGIISFEGSEEMSYPDRIDFIKINGKVVINFISAYGSTFCGLSQDNSSLIVFMEEFDMQTQSVDCQRCQAVIDAQRGTAARMDFAFDE